jgi:hypothetical protein
LSGGWSVQMHALTLTVITPLIRWGQTYDEIASPNNYAWAFESWVTAFVN